MNLTKKYMENQGTLGYLHESDYERETVILSYAEEGCHLDHWYCSQEEADRIVEHWGSTGDFIVREFDFFKNQHIEKVTQPTRVHKSIMNKTYFRKMYPDQPTEKHGG